MARLMLGLAEKWCNTDKTTADNTRIGDDMKEKDIYFTNKQTCKKKDKHFPTVMTSFIWLCHFSLHSQQ